MAVFHQQEALQVSFHPTGIDGARIVLTLPPDQLRTYADHLRHTIRMTNSNYRATVLPRLEEQRTAGERQRQEMDGRGRRAQEEAENLDLG